MPTSVKWNGKEVQNPILRTVLTVLIVILLPIFLALGMIFLFFVAVPIIFITDPFLKMFGRNGNIRERWENGRITSEWKLDHNSFRKRGTFLPDEEQGWISKSIGIVVFYGLIILLIWWWLF